MNIHLFQFFLNNDHDARKRALVSKVQDLRKKILAKYKTYPCRFDDLPWRYCWLHHEHVRNPMVVPDCPFDHKSSTPTVLPQAQAVSFCETDESRIKSAPDVPTSTVSVVGLQDAAIYEG